MSFVVFFVVCDCLVLLVVVCSLLFVVRCLFVVCCSFSVVCCLVSVCCSLLCVDTWCLLFCEVFGRSLSTVVC